MYGLIIAFKDFSPMDGIAGSPWADPLFRHFSQFINSPFFFRLISNTIIISSLNIIFGTIVPICLALLLNECRFSPLKRTVQTLTYMPHFLSWVIIYGILLAFFSQSTGVINNIIVNHGGRAVPFLTSNQWFRPIVVISNLWQGAGWSAIIYIAAMSGIDPTLYEAAKVDGVGRLGAIRYITLPCIRNTIVMLFILRLGQIMDAGFDQIFNLYNVQVLQVGDIIGTWVFRTGLEQLNFSLATAVGFFNSVIGFVMVLLSNQLAKKWGGGGIW